MSWSRVWGVPIAAASWSASAQIRFACCRHAASVAAAGAAVLAGRLISGSGSASAAGRPGERERPRADPHESEDRHRKKHSQPQLRLHCGFYRQ